MVQVDAYAVRGSILWCEVDAMKYAVDDLYDEQFEKVGKILACGKGGFQF